MVKLMRMRFWLMSHRKPAAIAYGNGQRRANDDEPIASAMLNLASTPRAAVAGNRRRQAAGGGDAAHWAAEASGRVAMSARQGGSGCDGEAGRSWCMSRGERRGGLLGGESGGACRDQTGKARGGGNGYVCGRRPTR